MLRSHRIPCSRVPVPLFVFLRRATPSHFHLHERPSHGYSISTTRYMPAHCFPRAHARSLFPTSRSHFRMSARPCLLAFPLAVPHTTAHCARPLAVSRTPTPARISAARSLFPARPLAVSRMPTPARVSAARSLFPARPLTAHACSLFPARPCPLAASRFLLRLALPPPPHASSSASRFLLRLVLPLRLALPSASPHLRLASLHSASPRSFTSEAERGAEHDKNWL
ncbi:hypothetical protein B0H13DRAFT_2371309 [Mycena leptocephala]|nr:hypothetical protein B0H13DRAFT_2371309 [Mycena leptocephala]